MPFSQRQGSALLPHSEKKKGDLAQTNKIKQTHTVKWSRGESMALCDFSSKWDIYRIVVFCLVFLRQSSNGRLLLATHFQNTRESDTYTEHPKDIRDHCLYPRVQQLFLSKTDPVSLCWWMLLYTAEDCNNNLTRSRRITKHIGSDASFTAEWSLKTQQWALT